MFKVNSNNTRTKPLDAVEVSFGVSLTQKQPPEVFYKKSCSQRYTNAELKISLYVLIHTKIIP